jgi:hypothetical protein
MTTPTTPLGDYGASLLRTTVPAVWGTAVAGLLAWAGPRLPGGLGDTLGVLLRSELVSGLLVAASIAGWYALARRLERRLPAWLVRAALGSTASPTYPREPDVQQ